jgi:hypothetical protein
MAGSENKEGSSEDGPGCPKIDRGQTQLGRHALAVWTFCWAVEGTVSAIANLQKLHQPVTV